MGWERSDMGRMKPLSSWPGGGARRAGDTVGWGGFPRGVGEPVPRVGAASRARCCHPQQEPPETHLEPADPDHAVHHLRHAEAVPEVVERVVPVVVVHAELRETEGPSCPRLLPTLPSKRPRAAPSHLPADCQFFGCPLHHPRLTQRPAAFLGWRYGRGGQGA